MSFSFVNMIPNLLKPALSFNPAVQPTLGEGILTNDVIQLRKRRGGECSQFFDKMYDGLSKIFSLIEVGPEFRKT